MAHRFVTAGESSTQVVSRAYTRPRTASSASTDSITFSEMRAGHREDRSPAHRRSYRDDPDGEQEDK